MKAATHGLSGCDSRALEQVLSSCDSQGLEHGLSSCDSQVLEHRLSSCDFRALEHRLSSCDSQGLERGLSSCDSWALGHGLSGCDPWAPECWLGICGAPVLVVVARGLSSFGSKAPEHRLSSQRALAYLLCSGIFPDQESNSCPLHYKVDS